MLYLGFRLTVTIWFLSSILEEFIEHFPSSFSCAFIKMRCAFKIARMDFTLNERAVMIHVKQ